MVDITCWICERKIPFKELIKHLQTAHSLSESEAAANAVEMFDDERRRVTGKEWYEF
jgi:hypothetical protein